MSKRHKRDRAIIASLANQRATSVSGLSTRRVVRASNLGGRLPGEKPPVNKPQKPRNWAQDAQILLNLTGQVWGKLSHGFTREQFEAFQALQALVGSGDLIGARNFEPIEAVLLEPLSRIYVTSARKKFEELIPQDHPRWQEFCDLTVESESLFNDRKFLPALFASRKVYGTIVAASHGQQRRAA